MQGKKKWIFNIVFLLLVIALTLYGLFRGSDLAQLQMLIHQADFRWWLLAFVLVIAFILGESIVLHDIMRTLKAPHHLSHCFLYSFIGFFFSCITPSAGGGQPAQVYFMRKDHIDPAVSVPVLILVTITYKLVLILFALFVFLFRPPAVITALEPVAAVVYSWHCIKTYCLWASMSFWCCFPAPWKPHSAGVFAVPAAYWAPPVSSGCFSG